MNLAATTFYQSCSPGGAILAKQDERAIDFSSTGFLRFAPDKGVGQARLDSLRLKAGIGTMDQLTADLDAARDVETEIDLAIDARREVETALRPARGAAE